MPRVTNKEIIAEIERQRGNLTAAARVLGLHRSTLYKRAQRSATLQAAIEGAREAMLDEAESVLYDKVLAGSTAELIFFLKTRGKGRGYVERQEVTGEDGGALTIRVVYDDAGS